MAYHSGGTGKKIGLSLLLAMLTVAVILGFGMRLSEPGQSSGRIVLADLPGLVHAVFPQQPWTQQGMMFTAPDGGACFVEALVPGSFTGDNRDEVLLALRPAGSPGHAADLYQLNLAVFDNASGQLAAPVQSFSADEGSWQVFASPARAHVFFAGSTTYQGWATWQGGLWQAGSAWRQVWPVLVPGQAAEAWWQDRAVRIQADGIELQVRKTLPRSHPDQLIPDDTWEPDERLAWDPDAGTFAKP